MLTTKKLCIYRAETIWETSVPSPQFFSEKNCLFTVEREKDFSLLSTRIYVLKNHKEGQSITTTRNKIDRTAIDL